MQLNTRKPASGKKDVFIILEKKLGGGEDIFHVIYFILICLVFCRRSSDGNCNIFYLLYPPEVSAQFRTRKKQFFCALHASHSFLIGFQRIPGLQAPVHSCYCICCCCKRKLAEIIIPYVFKRLCLKYYLTHLISLGSLNSYHKRAEPIKSQDLYFSFQYWRV